MTSTGIRELRDNLSRYIRRIEAGERMAITANGRVVAELPPNSSTLTVRTHSAKSPTSIAATVLGFQVEQGRPVRHWPPPFMREA